VEDVVVAVRMELCAAVLLIETEAGDTLQVVGLVAPEGELDTEHVRATVPANELDGVTVMVEVLPLVAPGVTEMFPLLERVKLLVPLVRSQNFEQPSANTTTTNEAATNNTRARFPVFIAVPSLHFPICPRHRRHPAHRILCTVQEYRFGLESGETLRCMLLKIRRRHMQIRSMGRGSAEGHHGIKHNRLAGN
jgi:hypothetical protein